MRGQTLLEVLISKKDLAALKTFVLKSDIHFAKNWALEKANIEEIDHFENGYVLTWTKTVNNIRYLRTYVFNLNSKFVSSHEQRFLRDTLLSQGSIEFKNKTIQYISQVIINKKSLKKLNGNWNYEVDGYNYEIYDSGKLACIYKTVHLNYFYMLFEKSNKDKIELTKGNDCLSIKK
jgi:hypothetical protein